MTDVSYDPRTGRVNGEVEATPLDQVDAIVAAAAACAIEVAATPPAERVRWSAAIADALEAARDELVDLADAETALGRPRLEGEVARTAGQLRFYADVAVEGSYLGATIDHAAGANPPLARVNVPLGPVAVFGASNFPFAFSVLGNDTASALAAGCPVVVKGHPAHPLLSQRLGALATEALRDAGAPDGVLGIVHGFDAGVHLVAAPQIAAVAFTGSQRAGMALREAAQQRDVPIPVFAEMGTVNPVVVTPAAAEARLGEIASGFVGSFTLGTGQFCTKPGLLLAPRGSRAAEAVASALRETAPRGWALTQGIADAARTGVGELVDAGAEVVAEIAGPDDGWSVSSTVLSVPLDALQPGSRLLEECFGPVALVAEYDDETALTRTVGALQGTLAATVVADGDSDPDLPGVLAELTSKAGRVTVGDFPTGVAYTWAQHHGGPWPATSDPTATSVGAGALSRFTRPVTYQSVPDAALPAPLRESNPWGIPRRVDGRLMTP
ncbi:aldehyde dehydrogenase family protein [Mumia sp. zg.B17]|uniref:aldehyde dehydrogenase family protein n=1 Tax=Mumia sp. zg.B17 TaxID=2855446 RepID=UPI001C6ED254|nr:aldehyde dehydrogenase family protein [Mumia sp. zg.B17]MBW9207574.1 aldehyde dehydrogenase family protein [Mumia sp. zg.B17]